MNSLKQYGSPSLQRSSRASSINPVSLSKSASAPRRQPISKHPDVVSVVATKIRAPKAFKNESADQIECKELLESISRNEKKIESLTERGNKQTEKLNAVQIEQQEIMDADRQLCLRLSSCGEGIKNMFVNFANEEDVRDISLQEILAMPAHISSLIESTKFIVEQAELIRVKPIEQQ